MEVTTSSTEETKKLAYKLARSVRPGTVIALYGDLGSGKTTFTRYLVEALGIDAKVQSPTFVIVRNYKRSNNSDNNGISEVIHMDFYRIQSVDGLKEFDLEYFFGYGEFVTIVEWPEIVENYLPPDTMKISFEYAGENERKINVQNTH
ncbi:tRNA (adenosine(37)-N6)-threonylcarbamoyltransferase complex ATPase subunit type 1 TsaE [candidate division WWE3 bacterium]|jgi:tRNA threonylcarbamoyladenosine biosynthesis protein TsaE|uniref:tRNA threonylcarbamoyladenosine biosynthesis protein TsaE n=1 Tax=candidate division WWE3 bacterium TaxID=2053526 RepID=A0A3A4ZCH9_UNCKA|nr:MAG: tRNA (adenosine(37)-N6)-threonylcarbamoyltransferase complex ATPase subunit type 1 TsaE [candidate division WWE3 bacterium]